MGQSVDILTIVLETLTEILKLDDGFTASIGSKVTTLSIACFVKFNADPVICPIIEGILPITYLFIQRFTVDYMSSVKFNLIN